MNQAQAAIADLDNALAEFGEDVTLVRFSDDGLQTPLYEVPCRANVRADEPQQLIGGIAHDTIIVLSPTDIAGRLPGLPVRDDRVLLQCGTRAANVQTVAPIYVGGVLVRLDLLVRE